MTQMSSDQHVVIQLRIYSNMAKRYCILRKKIGQTNAGGKNYFSYGVRIESRSVSNFS